jgi:hypothetical protein
MLQWCDNFSNYGVGTAGSNNALDGLVYAHINNQDSQFPVDPDGSSSGRVFVLSGNNSSSNLTDTRMACPTPNKRMGCGARFYRTTLPSTSGARPVIIGYRTAANARMYDLIVEPNGALSVYDDSVDLIATTTVPIFTTNSWQHIEFYMDAETGDFEVRREGVSVLTGTELVPQNVNIGIISWTNRQSSNSSTGLGLYMKDLVVWDDLGSYNNDFMGSVSVLTRALTADNSNTGWVPSTGTELYPLLDETTPNDADYMTAAAVETAEFALEDLPTDITSVRAIQTMVRAEKSDGGDATLQVSMRSGAAYDAGADHAVTTAMTYHWDISEEDPNTASQWTPGTFDDASLRIVRTS